MAFLRHFLIVLLLVTGACGAIGKPDHNAVASAHPLATQAGLSVLDQGGNAFDAAVAVSAALAVVEPYGSGMGGGGFWLLHRASDGHEVMVDGREKAPMAADSDFYQSEAVRRFERPSLNGPMAAGIPGQPAALAHIAEHYGRLPLSVSLGPAIRLAREGFVVDERYRQLMTFRLSAVSQWPAASAIFLDKGKVPELGMVIQQKDLAHTLEQLSHKGAEAFYRGNIAKAMVASVRRHGGAWTLNDLAQYQVVERQPLVGTFEGLRVVTAAPPSAGGIGLINMLNQLELWPWRELNEADQTHLLVEVMRRAYRDRAHYLGDPDFVSIPTERLLSKDYAAGQVTSIRLDTATASGQLNGRASGRPKGRHTTHFSILDTEGNRVAATLSINYPFGSGFVAEGTGVLLNDEMDDFATGQTGDNAYGLIDHGANRIAPGKRPLSSMTPTFVESENGVAILGTPGGSRIVTMVLLGVLEFAQGRPVSDWVSRGRFHHQFFPDVIQYEPHGLSQEVLQLLAKKGHQFKPVSRRYGNMQAVHWNKKTGDVTAASDPRGHGEAVVTKPR